MEEHISELHKNIKLINEEIDNQQAKHNFDDSDLINEENLKKIKTILLTLGNYNFNNYTEKNEIECFYSQINNSSEKERIVLDTVVSLVKERNQKNKKMFFSYKDIIEDENEENKIKKGIEEDESIVDEKIFTAVDRVAHKTLHKEKNEKNIKICQIYNDLSDFEFKYSDKNIGYNNIDKLINNIKQKRINIQYIAIKSIIVSMMNLTQELINNYYKISEEMNLNMNVNVISDEEYINDDENELVEINPNVFEILFNDYVFTCNRCSFLENYFIESFNNFRNTYKIDFTLSELFTDIFFDGIFHNKFLCKKFISLYIGNEKCNEKIRKILAKIIKIISDISIPLKSKIIELLPLKKINQEKDLMSTIITNKNSNIDYIQNDSLLSNVSNKFPINSENIININNSDKNEIEIENESEIKDEIKEEKKSKKEKKFSESEMEHKTVDEIYNYINDNSDVKVKKKKRNKKKKNKKIQINKEINIINEDIKDNSINLNQIIEEVDDEIVLKFKQEISANFIDANRINKIKPVISENFLKIISEKY